MLSVVGTKVIALILMAILTLIMALLPIYVRNLMKEHLKGKRAQMALSVCLCFGGGVLLATVFLHLIPEAHHLISQAYEKKFLPYTSYPVAELIVCVGFFILYIIEEVVHSCSSMAHQLHGHSHGVSEKESESLKPPPMESKNGHVDEQTHQTLCSQNELENNTNHSELEPTEHHKAVSTMKAIVVVAAFSFHSVMEGLALGLVHSKNDVWFLFAALCGHKLVIAFCIAMELLEVGVNIVGFLISMIIFSLASPLGGLLGTLIVSLASNEDPAGFITTAVLQGISAGTILYVTFCEVLERERSKHDGRHIRLIAVIIGFIFMAVLQIFDDPLEIEDKAFENLESLVNNFTDIIDYTTETPV